MAEDKIAVPGTGIARPEFLKGADHRGTEHLTKADIQMPRLALAQSLSPEVQDDDPRQITDLKVGMLFNSLTKEIIGKGPIEFTIVRADPPRWVEFYPRTDGGGVKDMNVPANDPRTRFTMEGNKSIPPMATQFYDFIIMMLPVNPDDPMSSLIALSFKSTGLKVARQLNGLMKLRDAPSFAGKYTLSTGMTQNAKGKYAIYQVANSNITSESSAADATGRLTPGWVNETIYRIGERMFEALKDRQINIDREPGDVDDSMAANPEGQDVSGMPAM